MNLKGNLRFLSLPSALAFALVVLLASTLAVASTPQGQFEKTFPVSGPVNLEVLTRSGDITVRAGASGSVFIRGKIYVGDHWLFGNRHTDVSDIEKNPPLRQEGNSIKVHYVNAHDISINYEITVPADTTVRGRSGSGDLILEGTHGNADLESGSGNIKLRQLAGEIRLQTGSGDVEAREIAGAVRGSTGSGNMEVEETGSGDMDLRTGSGNLKVRGIHGGLRAEAGSGDITAEGTQTAGWEIRSGSGNVHVRLPANAAFDADFSTSSGSLEVNAPVTTTVQGHVETRKAIRGQVRGGGPLLTVHTGSGDIHIE
jgi:hypothetical protein